MNYEEINTETSLNEESGINSKREMIFKTHYPSMFNFDEKKKSNKSNKKMNNNIGIKNSTNNYKIKNFIGNSLYHESQKNKEKETIKSTSNAFIGLKSGLKHTYNEDDILNKKREFDKYKREKCSSKSLKKKKNKSINYYQVKEETKNDNLYINNEIINDNNKIMINNNQHNYIGEKIIINMKNLNFIFNKFKESNNITDIKNEELSDKNIYEKKLRLSCIINNSPFINSNIYIKNKKCISSIQDLLGKDNSRFFEKNKNIYKGKNINELLKNIPEDIFQEIDYEINDKLYDLEPSKISIGQIYKNNNKYMRNITNLDGNAFLKAFLFNYLEQIISKKEINKLTEILGRIKVGLKLIKKDKETINKVLSIFKIIVKYIEQDNIVSAYIILIKSFSENYDFENNLMLYMRQCLSESIKRHQCYFKLEYLKEIIPKRYIKMDDKNKKEYFDYELYLKEIINSESNNNELQYELLVYYFLAPIFAIDLIIYTDNDTITNKISFKYSNTEDKDIITIKLFIKFGSVSIIYSNDYFQKYENIIPLKCKDNYPIDKIKIIKNEEKKNCYMCHIIPFELIQLDYKFELICKKCLNEIIKKIIEKRYNLFSDTDNFYFHEEYYCNKINYIINPEQNDSYELNISINDIRNILNNNLDISTEIHEKIIKSYKCGHCNKKFEKSLYCYCMNKCGHFICSNCLKEYILKITEEKVVFNIYENKLKQIKYLCLECNNEIYLSKNLIYNLFNDDTYINKAEERLIEAAENICCFCGLGNENKIKKKFVIENEYISSNYSEDNYRLVHSICKDCYKKMKINDLKNPKKIFFCDFCGENHNYNKIKFDVQKRKRACCTHI